MKKKIAPAALLAALLVFGASPDASARDDRHMFPIKEALESASDEKLDDGIKLYFGNQKHPPVAQKIGEWATNKKTNAFGKSDETACKWVFLSAVIALQERARKEGGDAVINIRSNYKNIKTASDTEYMCGAGNVVAGVALVGTVVKLAK